MTTRNRTAATLKTATLAAIVVAVVIGGCGGKTIDPATVVTDSFTDPRDGTAYRTVKIGSQTWMAENLNYVTYNSWCYGYAGSNCVKYGGLYTWDAAMTACPDGWRLPSYGDWDSLMMAVGGRNKMKDGSDYWEKAGKKLKSKGGWKVNGHGTDDYGFSAMPGGSRNSKGCFYYAGDADNYGRWWSATYIVFDDWGVHGRGIGFNGGDGVRSEWFDKAYAFSVRCLME